MAMLAVGREALLIAADRRAGDPGAADRLPDRRLRRHRRLSARRRHGRGRVPGRASAWPVAKRLRESEALVRRQEVDLANLAQLSQYIVQHLRESILVVDPSDRIRLINESAARDARRRGRGARRAAGRGLAAPALPADDLARRHRCRTADERSAGSFVGGRRRARSSSRTSRRWRAAEPAPVLIFLEDTGALAARVQQSKLAALGRLTASIAHEIRNPVGAMSHAAQLLARGQRPRRRRAAPDRDHAQQCAARQRHRRQRAAALAARGTAPGTTRHRRPGARRFREEFCATAAVRPPSASAARCVRRTSRSLVDPSQLHQIVWNLCENALRYGARRRRQRRRSSCACGAWRASGRAYLEVADRGAGVAESDVERIFEPFFTRGRGGTGLGLFLARELAEMQRRDPAVRAARRRRQRVPARVRRSVALGGRDAARGAGTVTAPFPVR